MVIDQKAAIIVSKAKRLDYWEEVHCLRSTGSLECNLTRFVGRLRLPRSLWCYICLLLELRLLQPLPHQQRQLLHPPVKPFCQHAL